MADSNARLPVAMSKEEKEWWVKYHQERRVRLLGNPFRGLGGPAHIAVIRWDGELEGWNV